MNKKQFMKLLLVVVLVSYAAQVPYYVHQYYAPHRFLPSLYGSVLLGLTLIWFLMAYRKLLNGSKLGYFLMLSFLTVEFLFYLQTQISQLLISHRLFLHVYKPDGVLLFIVFGIGYINFFAAAYFVVYLLANRKLSTIETKNKPQ